MSSLFTDNIKYLESRLVNNPNSADKIKVAKYYLDNGYTQKAIELCKESLNDYPNYLTAYLILATSYISESNFAAAHEIVKQADIYFPHHWVFEGIKKCIWQSDLKSADNKTTYFEEIHRSLFLSNSQESIDDETDDTLDPIAATHKFSFNFDDYIPKQTKKQSDSLVDSDDDYITLNHFRPTAADFAFDDDEIIKSLLNDGEIDAILKPKEEWHYYGDSDSKTNITEYKNVIDDEEDIQLEAMVPPLMKKSDSPDKIVLEKELDQLLGDSDFELELAKDGALEDLSHIGKTIQEEKPNSPPIVSKTMADVFISQGKFEEAMSIYAELLKKKEITMHEYDMCIKILQEKMAPPPIDI